jgi:biopolymer transport protein TolQ
MTVPDAQIAGSLMNPVSLFLQADIIVKLVMLGLLAASIWTWTIIFGHGLKLIRMGRSSEKFERDFWKAEDVARFVDKDGHAELPAARIVKAGLGEWRRSTASKPIDREATRSRLASVMMAAAATEIDKLTDRLNTLATVGAVAPFVGLFGTVWGIMRSFSDIAGEQNTSLTVVAPGIAEALFATAIGLFAAIPAVIAYNRLTHRLNKYEARLNRFADGFHGLLSRELERM